MKWNLPGVANGGKILLSKERREVDRARNGGEKISLVHSLQLLLEVSALKIITEVNGEIAHAYCLLYNFYQVASAR